MTDKIAIDRSVVEQALEALETGIQYDYHGNPYSDNDAARCGAYDALRAALEQPDMGNPVSVPQGWKLVPVEPTAEMLNAWCEAENKTSKHLHASDVMQAGYRAMLAAAPQPPVVEQPQVEQEPTPNGATHRQPKQGAFYKRVDGKWYVWSRMETGEPHRWYISPGTTESCLEPLYTHPHPPRQPLTDDQIGEIEGWFSNEFGLEAKHSVDFARAIEAAHGITRETK